MEIRLVTQSDPALPKEFAQILIGIGALTIQYLVVTFAFAMRARTSVFRREFMRKFDEEHNKIFPNKRNRAPEFGYPDLGTGYYGKHLSYANWNKMAIGQRVQHNFHEQITFALVATLTVSQLCPCYAVWCIWGFFIGRLMFAIGYTYFGPTGRIPGALIGDIVILAWVILSVMVYVKMFKKE